MLAPPNPEHDIVVQSVESNIFAIKAQSQIPHLREGSGVFAGASAGTSLFNLGAWPAQQVWRVERSTAGLCEHIWLRNPIAGDTENVGSAFSHTITVETLQENIARNRRADEIFDREHVRVVIVQNFDKVVQQVSVSGPGANVLHRAVAKQDGIISDVRITAATRYIGHYLHTYGDFAVELGICLKAAAIVWRMWRGF